MQDGELELAIEWINTTQSPLFICGKAGTGKTTFLRELPSKTYKKTVLVSPTGIAAANAGGATIHTQFNLPLTPITPQSRGLLDGISFNKSKRKTLVEMDLLVIDEISMLRADLLDSIDYLLKKVRSNTLAFGGVQLLLVGDPFQLAPVVSEKDWKIINGTYSSPYFFEAICLKECLPVLITLEKIFRQKDKNFINLLNAVRNNQIDDIMLDSLNARCLPTEIIPAGHIVLTTHNEKAKAQNQLALENAAGEIVKFSAIIEGFFDQSQCLAESILELKLGVPVILIKNHKGLPERYFNGKMGKVIKIDTSRIEVSFPNEESLSVEREMWVETEYIYDEKIDGFQKVVKGSLQQFPLKLGTALTIHKSQGLTFEHAVLDLGEVFAPGQLYVALSRLTSMNGLWLKTPISRKMIKFDIALQRFETKFLNVSRDSSYMERAQFAYIHSLVLRWLDWKVVLNNLFTGQFSEESTLLSCFSLIRSFDRAASSYTLQLDRALLEKSLPDLYERTLKAASYFLEKTDNELIQPLQEFIRQNRNNIHGKRYLNAASSMNILIKQKKKMLIRLQVLITELRSSGSFRTALEKSHRP